MAKLQFFRGLYASYVQATHGEGIYFATDKKVIKMNGVDYVGPLADSDAVKSVALNADGSKFVITYLGGTTSEIELAKSEYESNIDDKTLAMPIAVGGIAKGTKVSQLEGKTFNEIFDDLLFPSVNPTKGSDPSLSGFTLSSTTSPVEVGTAVSSISAAGLNKGSWSTYNNGLAYAGDVTSIAYEIKINGETYTDIAGLPENYTKLGDQTYKATVNYGKGPTPVNNKGVEVPTMAAPAGSVTATRTKNVTAPWYASTANASAETPVVKQSLIRWKTTAGQMDTGQFTVQPSGTLPQVFKLPRQMQSLYLKNALNGNMEIISDHFADYAETTEKISINGNEITYYVYTYKGSTRGSVTLQAKF